MKKQLFTLLFTAGIAICSFAQSKPDSLTGKHTGTKFSIGTEAGLPVGNISTAYNFVLGGSLKLEVPTSTTTYLTLSAGYNAFFLKDLFKGFDIPSTSGFIPLKAGLKGYVADNFFLEGQAGIVFSTESGGGHAFAWSPGLGYSFNNGLELGLRYEGWTNGGTTGQISARIAYRF
ncbi:MAG: hypothetical protein JST50_20605 [Bacteroidetes bacterium]|jgi:hypothetical protein|nr:hypothetical protein [Bacteroidota bacterium]